MIRAFLIIISLLIASPVYAAGGATCMMAGGGTVATAPTCASYKTNTSTGGSWGVGSESVYYRQGIFLTDATSPCICKVRWYLVAGAGDVSAKTFTTYIYALDGSNNISSTLGTSSSIVGSSISLNAYNDFTFSSCVTLSGGSSDHYGIALSMGGTDASNYIKIDGWYADADSGYSNHSAWNNDVLQSSTNADYDKHFEIWKQ